MAMHNGIQCMLSLCTLVVVTTTRGGIYKSDVLITRCDKVFLLVITDL